MKFILCSDWHLLLKNPEGRTDNAFETQWKKLRYIYNYAVEHEIETILQAGDVFDKPRSWYLLDKWLSFFAARDSEEFPQLLTIYGQHDTHFYSESTRGATVLGVLLRIANVNLLKSWTPAQRSWSGGGVDVYGCSYGEDLPEVKNKGSRITNILVIHKEITPEKMWEGQEAIYAPKFLNTHPEFDLILCGDIHRTFKFASSDGKRFIVNTGPLLRREATIYNYTHKPGFWVYDAKKKLLSSYKVIPHEKAEEVLTRAHLDKKELVNKKLSKFIEAVKKAQSKSGVGLKADFKTNLM